MVISFVMKRFLSERQVNQLSSWVKPKLKKYTTCTSALQEFRKFVNYAIADPDLQVKEKVFL